jgi:CRP-like cAMP-binding protein
MKEFGQMVTSQDKSEFELGGSPLAKVSPCAELVAAIEKWSFPVLFRSGDVIFNLGDRPNDTYFVKTGEVVLTMPVSGGGEWTARAGEGSILGLPAIMGNEPYSLTATVSRDSLICRISRENFHQLMQENPGVCCNVLQILASEVLAARSALSRLLG